MKNEKSSLFVKWFIGSGADRKLRAGLAVQNEP